MLAEMLADRYGVRRVVLVGSLARGDFGATSDIDLAVEGLPHDALFRAGAALGRQADGFDVDWVPIESACPTFIDDMQRDGVVLHADD
jgi:predicted nucleotidyltransferase